MRVIKPADGGTWGIMGGSFNPIHLGHLIMAESVMHSLDADGMLFVPARTHPFKKDHNLAPYEDRIDMVRQAVADNNRFLIEEVPPESKYTLDLVFYLRDTYPRAQFSLVLGSDLIDEFHSWYKPDEIVQNVRIVIAARPGYKRKPGTEPILQGAEMVMIPQYDISSSEIRSRIESGLSIKYMVPEAVLSLINRKRLYAD